MIKVTTDPYSAREVCGVLRDEISIAPNGGYGFGPRHLDFHPSRSWIYVSLERQNALAMFSHEAGTLTATLVVPTPPVEPATAIT